MKYSSCCCNNFVMDGASLYEIYSLRWESSGKYSMRQRYHETRFSPRAVYFHTKEMEVEIGNGSALSVLLYFTL